MLKPVEITDAEADRRGVAPGWWGADDNGRLILGPYPSREAALVGITNHGAGAETPAGA
ncbi:hypothetical protein [Chelatococcus reniformis]|uniref:Uncharacterized protein n=1 Tax=Chelatococcus reniformis TaxID=1494448 RepID=A0A916XEK3_9HYPH|nr:hypothetical protein [Chelatococcus reniformis]GGC68168.1 hypothetical protein GCM10010994_28430 [Chelatococcus reniformis]